MGFAVYLRLAVLEGLRYPTRLLGNQLPADTSVVWVLGLLWLVAALGFLVGAGGLVTEQGWWRPVIIATAALSILVSVLGWPDARFGVVVSGAVLIIVLFGTIVAPRLAVVR